jgi:hypothetical protein
LLVVVLGLHMHLDESSCSTTDNQEKLRTTQLSEREKGDFNKKGKFLNVRLTEEEPKMGAQRGSPTFRTRQTKNTLETKHKVLKCD